LILDVRLIVITDHKLAAPRTIYEIVEEALHAGAPAIQLRDKHASAAELLDQASRLRDLTSKHSALLFINDRVDVASHAHADGAHLGPSDLPVAEVARLAPGLLLGYSTDDPARAVANAAAGASYIGCGAVYGTASKNVGDERIGIEGLKRVIEAVRIPVVAIGGITIQNVKEIAEAGAAGTAVIGAVMQADHPGRAVEALLRPFSRG
jgi:thiamine-phosphate pyrophosphorylase